MWLKLVGLKNRAILPGQATAQNQGQATPEGLAWDGFSSCEFLSTGGRHYTQIYADLLRLLLIIAAYFGLGAYHNYNQYGASGWDLIP